MGQLIENSLQGSSPGVKQGGEAPPKTACSQARLINLIGGGAGGGKSGKGVGSEREAGKGKAGRGIPQDGGRREKQETVTHTQHCFIFCNGKREKRRKLGLKGTGSPPPHASLDTPMSGLIPCSS